MGLGRLPYSQEGLFTAIKHRSPQEILDVSAALHAEIAEILAHVERTRRVGDWSVGGMRGMPSLRRNAHSLTAVSEGKVHSAKEALELPDNSGGDAAEIGGQAGYPVWDKRRSGADEGEIGPLKAAAHAECDVPREP